ncbi:3-methyl-2-oxobutanoate hydroxymethyltransferase, partial [Sulfuricurvum sp.]|uniref:3-methyl-2-oxobutanoate hydroxymethyltransferase n=1 Tax=Sulfuricurvum sp. TaxID=2025608 RepID=UPI002D2E72FA
MKKLTIGTILKRKGTQPLVMITAYDALFARLFTESADILLVGDSLNMSFGGNPDTLSISMEQMIYHTNAVCKGAPNTFVITDMPFGTYIDEATAFANAMRVYRETPADAVKIEGGADKAYLVHYLTSNGIA